ncbi:hypothetical protein KAI92_02220 [Candidatus Parcubacteria bacterium]|nr:hypothetical protein [Candidatus Parcubacteria bacterium]
MMKKIIILSILISVTLVIGFFNVSKASDNLNSTTTTDKLKNEKTTSYHNYHVPHEPLVYTLYLDQTKNKNNIEILKNIVEFISKNIWGFLFIFFTFFIFWYYWLHNLLIMRRFKREIMEKKGNFKIARCKNENTKSRIYMVVYDKKKNKEENPKENPRKGKYYHIVDSYTLTKLGYNSHDDAPRKDEEFSRKNKELKNRIELHDIKSDIGFIIGSAEKFKELRKSMKIE